MPPPVSTPAPPALQEFRCSKTHSILPLLAGIFAIVALRDPRVIAGFEEMEGAVDDEDETSVKEPEEDEVDEEEDDDD